MLWQVWDRIECPVLILRGEHSELLARATVGEMTRRGVAGKAGRVSAVEFADCGHAPALMDGAQIAVVSEFLFPAGHASCRMAPTRQAQ